jgi:predicted DNA-binding transcriptional regulator AlpA
MARRATPRTRQKAATISSRERERRDTQRAEQIEHNRLITTREVCSRLTLSRTTLWRLRDELCPVRLTPTRVAYRERDVEAFIAARLAG